MLATGTGRDRIVRRTDARAGRFSFPIPRDADAHAVALLVAAMHDRPPTVRVLLEAGVEWARQLGHEAIAAMLERRPADG
jgi:hypothetical protein